MRSDERLMASKAPATDDLVPDVRTGRDRFVSRLQIDRISFESLERFAGVSVGDSDVARMLLRGGPFRLGPLSDDVVVLARISAGSVSLVSDRQAPQVADRGAVVVLAPSQHVYLRGEAGTQLTAAVHTAGQLAAFGVRVPTADATVLDRTPLLAKPIWAFLDALVGQPPPWPTIVAYSVEQLLQEMAASVLLEAAGAGRLLEGTQSLYERARAHIVAYVRDPRLTPDVVASSLGVTSRSLQREFAAAGTTIAEEIRRQRVQVAAATLASKEAIALSLDDIATACGYLNATALRRAFSRYGLDAPRTHRRHPTVALA